MRSNLGHPLGRPADSQHTNPTSQGAATSEQSAARSLGPVRRRCPNPWEGGSMRTHRWLAALIAAIALGVSACGNSGPSAGAPVGDVGSSAVAVPSGDADSGSPAGGPSSDTGSGSPGSQPSVDPTQGFPQGGIEGAAFSDGNNGGTDVQAAMNFMTAVIKDVDSAWSDWFTQQQLNAPQVAYEIIGPGQTYDAGQACADTTGQYIFASDYPNAFYCPADNSVTGYKGTIILPATTFSKMWSGNILGRQVSAVSRTGNFAAAVLEAHEYGHKVQDELSDDFNVPAPTNPNKELLADCFAGNYAYNAFTRGYLEDGDEQVALDALGAIGDDPNSHGSPEQRDAAFEIGYRGTQDTPKPGVPAICINVYWPAFAAAGSGGQ